MNKKYAFLMIGIVTVFSIVMLLKKNYEKSNLINNGYNEIVLGDVVEGDVDGNGKVEVKDYILIRKHILKNPELTGVQLQRADVDGDKKVSTSDYIVIRKIILGTYSNNTKNTTATPTPTPSFSVGKKGENGGTSNNVINDSSFNSSSSNSSGEYNFNVDTNEYNFNINPNGGLATSAPYSQSATPNPNTGIVSVSGVSLNKTTLELNMGKKETLVATVSPSNATNQELTWSSSNTSVATVNTSGKITAVGKGTTKITVKTKDGSKTATCVVKVKYDITADSKYDNYSNVASCYSDTLNYRIIKYHNDYNNVDQYITLVWVKDAYEQMNVALPHDNGQTAWTKADNAYNILENEYNLYFSKYSSGCMVATNASFFDLDNKVQSAKIIINKGRVIRSTSEGEGLLGLTEDYALKYFAADDKGKGNHLSDYQDYGVRNTITISYTRNLFEENGKYYYRNSKEASGKTEIKDSKDTTRRTQLCKYDDSNYILMTGMGDVNFVARDLFKVTGCSRIINLDGSDSSKLYYQKDNKIVTLIDPGRHIPDMLYFSQHVPKIK